MKQSNQLQALTLTELEAVAGGHGKWKLHGNGKVSPGKPKYGPNHPRPKGGRAG